MSIKYEVDPVLLKAQRRYEKWLWARGPRREFEDWQDPFVVFWREAEREADESKSRGRRETARR